MSGGFTRRRLERLWERREGTTCRVCGFGLGTATYELEFADPDSSDPGDNVEYCPGCGRQTGGDIVFPDEEEWWQGGGGGA